MPDTGLSGALQPVHDNLEQKNTEDQAKLPDHDDEDAIDHNEEPPLKRRKVADSRVAHRSPPRPISPPWKRVGADGPTSFVENGRRRSGRTNVIPLELQPQTNKRQTRASFDKVLEDKSKQGRPMYNTSSRKVNNEAHDHKAMPTAALPRRGPGRPPGISKSANRPKPPAIKTESTSPKHSKFSPVQPRSNANLSQRHGRQTLNQHKRTASSTIARDEPRRLETNGYFQSESSEEEDSESEASSRLPSPPITLQKIRLRVRPPKPSILTPANIPLPKKYSSFQEFLDRDELEPRPGQDLVSPDQIHKEAMARRKVKEARKPGRPLHRRMLKILPNRQLEPRKQFAHFDHLLAHITHFRTLLRAEHKEHKRTAEIIAHEAKKFVEEKRKRNKVKTAEEIEQEEIAERRNAFRSVVKDLEKLWTAAEAEVIMQRRQKWEEEQQARVKRHLNRVLQRTDEMLETSMRRDGSDVESSRLGPENNLDEETSLASDDSEQNMSDSGSEDDSELGSDNEDAKLTAEELRLKYSSLPVSVAVSDVNDETSDNEAADNSEAQGVDVMDSGVEPPSQPSRSSVGFQDASDESDRDTEMDSEFDSSDSGEDEGDDDEDESEVDDSDGGGLLGLLFSKREMAELKSEAIQNDEIEENAEESDPISKEKNEELIATNELGKMDVEPRLEVDNNRLADSRPDPTIKPSPAPNGHTPTDERVSQEPSTQASPRASEPDSASSLDARADVQIPATPAESKPALKTRIPSLLRGTLREYQHEGLDWLADLYAHGRSGILADEMGLGKTIQSIALLAHLAVEYEVWGPHLIVVPTSVMLNWEMEFKKFCPGFKVLTYYGTQEERKQKRRGWMADDMFNVCITSYQLVLQDQKSFKRRKWQYMILDEAHNIKNFRSDRWQTMMTFNTRARLLLTGTPLQNNLTELWSLLYFLHWGHDTDGEEDGFAGLKEFSEWFKKPVETILEHGRQTLDEEDKEQVAKLHKVIRPFLLRRLKADVEKQMPLKYEHVELCRLSKRQRQLYDGFMSRAQTKETLASGNYLSIINALMQLRKVCNHPDLFETRPVMTSFAMSKSIAADFEIKDLLLRRKLVQKDPFGEIDLDFLQLVPISREDMSATEVIESTRLLAYNKLRPLRDNQWHRTKHGLPFDGYGTKDVLASLENIGRTSRLQELDRAMYYESYRHRQHPVYGQRLLKKLSFGTTYHKLSNLPGKKVFTKSWGSEQPIASLGMIKSIQTRSEEMEPLIQKYACITPAVVASGMSLSTVSEAGAISIRETQRRWPSDPFHEARVRLSIAFPDKRLLQYDCGKLQRLDKLLRELQAGGHRALIFTQMTKVLDILEQFLNIHGHRYLRLDGATKIEQRQILTDRFNNDPRILVFILSSRSGGLGINLTGADTVIFYDLDWNPAMDKQCTDRAHRIGQTRDVHIYRFVSEHTIESNILRKASQKQMLDDVVIQEGDFTTDYFNKVNYRDMFDDDANAEAVASAAMDRVLGNEKGDMTAFEQAEDQEDIAAAKVAVREVEHADDGDFDDKAVASTPHGGDAQTPGPFEATNVALDETKTGSEVRMKHIDEFLLMMKNWELGDVPIGPPKDKSKKAKKKGAEHRIRRVR